MAGGVGSHIKKLVRRFGVAGPCPGCSDLAHFLDERGIDWCKDHVPLIVEKMESNAKILEIPFSKFVAKRIVIVAIKRAEKSWL